MRLKKPWVVLCALVLAGATILPQLVSAQDSCVLPGTQDGQVAAGYDFSCVVTDAGTVTCFGNDAGDVYDNSGSNLWIGDTLTYEGTTTAVDDVVSITAGQYHLCALRSNGTVWCSGGNSRNQAGGSGSTVNGAREVDIDTAGNPLEDVVSVSAGSYHTCAATEDGEVYCWGWNTKRQLGISGQNVASLAKSVYPFSLGNTGRVEALQVSAGHQHSCAVVDGSPRSVLCWGDNSQGQLGLGTTTGNNLGTWASTLTSSGLDIDKVAAGGHTSCALMSDSTLECWGRNQSDAVEPADSSLILSTPTTVTRSGSAIVGVSSVATGGTWPTSSNDPSTIDLTCAVVADGETMCWGKNNEGQLGKGDTSTTGISDTKFTVISIGGVVDLINGIGSVSVSGDHACAVGLDGTTYCWGDNRYGKLGIETSTSLRNKATASHSDNNQDSSALTVCPGETKGLLALGRSFSCAVVNDGTVTCWGSDLDSVYDNTSGHEWIGESVLLYGTSTALDDVIQIAAGSQHMCALTEDGYVYCSGSNEKGQLGNPAAEVVPGKNSANGVKRVIDTNDADLSDIVSIGAGSYHTCAVNSQGEVYCWGYNNERQLGFCEGSPCQNVHSKAQTMPDFDLATTDRLQALQIDGGGRHSCALVKGYPNYVLCWGENSSGQLGVGSTAAVNLNSISEALTQGSAVPLEVSAGGNISCARFDDFTVQCWGSQSDGFAIPGGGVVDISTPATVTDGTDPISGVISIQSGGLMSGFVTDGQSATCTTQLDGTSYCWGYDGDGQLGDGSSTNGGPNLVRKNSSSTGNLENIITTAQSGQHGCALADSSGSGIVYCWGASGTRLGISPTGNETKAITTHSSNHPGLP